MHQLIIHHLGPIQDCNISIKQTTVLTGYQASGKSTIAKAIYFFRTIKDDIYNLVQRNKLDRSFANDTIHEQEENHTRSFRGDFERCVRSKFLNTFGTSYSMDSDMLISYRYSADVSVTISLREATTFLGQNFVWVDYPQTVRSFLKQIEDDIPNENELKQKLAELFDDSYETVYIPAGRSALTVLGSLFSYFYSTMDDSQKRLLDSCTRNYVERVMKLRPQFSNGLEGLLEGVSENIQVKQIYVEALNLIENILKGRYTVSEGEERIWIDRNHYTKINFASSGQQEVVWIVNMLFYYLVTDNKGFFIIEEPESNLFPESQKLIVELITLVSNCNNAVLITTHSPYVLGTINNMIYAGIVGALAPERVDKIISHAKWIDTDKFDAFFVKEGTAVQCVDQELMQIDNALLDRISHVINSDYDKLFDIENESGEEF